MMVKGLGQYVSIKVESLNEDIGTVMHPVRELGLKGGEDVFFSASDIFVRDLESETYFVMVRPEDIYGTVEE